MVLRSRMTKTLLPLEVTNQLVMTFDWLDLLPPESTRAGTLLRRILPYAFRSHRQELGLEGMYIDDALGVVAAAHPELFETREMGGDVETQGELTLGATVFDRRQAQKWRSNADVVISMDANRRQRLHPANAGRSGESGLASEIGNAEPVLAPTGGKRLAAHISALERQGASRRWVSPQANSSVTNSGSSIA